MIDSDDTIIAQWQSIPQTFSSKPQFAFGNEICSLPQVYNVFADKDRNRHDSAGNQALVVPPDLLVFSKAILQTNQPPNVAAEPNYGYYNNHDIQVDWYRMGWDRFKNWDWRIKVLDPRQLEIEKNYPLFLKISGMGKKPSDWNFSPLAKYAINPKFTCSGVVFEIIMNNAGTIHENCRIPVLASGEIATKCFGLKLYYPNLVGFSGAAISEFSIDQFARATTYSYLLHREVPFDYTFDTMDALTRVWNMGDENLVVLMNMLATQKPSMLPDAKNDIAIAGKNGIAKTWANIPIEEIKKENIMAYVILRSFLMQANKTVEGVKLSTIFNTLFSGKNKKEILDAIQKVDGKRNLIEYLKELPIWKDRRRAAIKAKGNRAFNLLMQEYEFLKLDEKMFPITSKIIKNGEIPLGTFFTKSEQYFLQNDNWQLWEEMLKKHKEVALEMAAEVSKRTTYEKDLMSYFYFILHSLPAYLKKYTGKKWNCIPRLVEDQTELEPPTTDGGIARNRSALTPIVDNEKCTVTVPYASLAIPGRQTTYCYGLDFCVLEKGLSLKGNVVMEGIEEKLNGRDDYGLCSIL